MYLKHLLGRLAGINLDLRRIEDFGLAWLAPLRCQVELIYIRSKEPFISGPYHTLMPHALKRPYFFKNTFDIYE